MLSTSPEAVLGILRGHRFHGESQRAIRSTLSNRSPVMQGLILRRSPGTGFFGRRSGAFDGQGGKPWRSKSQSWAKMSKGRQGAASNAWTMLENGQLRGETCLSRMAPSRNRSRRRWPKSETIEGLCPGAHIERTKPLLTRDCAGLCVRSRVKRRESTTWRLV